MSKTNTATAAKLATISTLHVILAPTGVWVFVGAVPATLGYEQPDGSDITEQQARNAASFGPRAAGVRTRTWPTREVAIAAANALGYEVA